jgi:serine/threonine protein kinase
LGKRWEWALQVRETLLLLKVFLILSCHTHLLSGRVKLGIHHQSGEKVAIKMIAKDQFKEKKPKTRPVSEGGQAISNWENPTAEEPGSITTTMLPKKLEREITIMKMIKHPNVMQIYDVYETPSQL